MIFFSNTCSTTSESDSSTAETRASSSIVFRDEAPLAGRYRFVVSKFSNSMVQQTGACAVDAGRPKRKTTWSLRSRRPTYPGGIRPVPGAKTRDSKAESYRLYWRSRVRVVTLDWYGSRLGKPFDGPARLS